MKEERGRKMMDQKFHQQIHDEMLLWEMQWENISWDGEKNKWLLHHLSVERKWGQRMHTQRMCHHLTLGLILLSDICFAFETERKHPRWQTHGPSFLSWKGNLLVSVSREREDETKKKKKHLWEENLPETFKRSKGMDTSSSKSCCSHLLSVQSIHWWKMNWSPKRRLKTVT